MAAAPRHDVLVDGAIALSLASQQVAAQQGELRAAIARQAYHAQAGQGGGGASELASIEQHRGPAQPREVSFSVHRRNLRPERERAVEISALLGVCG